MRLLLVLWLTVCLTACDLDAGPPRVIRLSGAGGLTKADAQVIATRLDAYTLRGLLRQTPKYTFSVQGGEGIVEASAAPEDGHTQYLLSRRGLLDVRSEDGTLWFDNTHITDVQAAIDDKQRPSLRLKLNDAATAHVAKLSAAPTPTNVLVRFDGELLSVARVTGAIPSGRLEVNLTKPLAEVHLISTVLRSGALSYTPGPVYLTAPPKS